MQNSKKGTGFHSECHDLLSFLKRGAKALWKKFTIRHSTDFPKSRIPGCSSLGDFVSVISNWARIGKCVVAPENARVITAAGPLFSAIAALSAVFLSIYFYVVTSNAQHSHEMYDTFRSYMQLRLEHAEMFDAKIGNTAAVSYVLSTAESIYLDTDDEGWRANVANILSDNGKLLEGTPVDCSSMNQGFVEFARKQAKISLHCSKDQ